MTPEQAALYPFRFSIVQLAANILSDKHGHVENGEGVIKLASEINDWIVKGLDETGSLSIETHGNVSHLFTDKKQ